MKIGEFFIDLIVDSSKGELTVGDLVTKMGQLEAATVGAVGVVFELASKLASFTDVSIRSALGLEEYATLTGESAQELQKWQRVAEQAHVSGDAVTNTLKHLSASIAEVARGGAGGLKPLVDALGIDLTGKGPTQILDAIRKSQVFAALPARQKTDLLTKVGIDPMLANVFKLTDAEFKKAADLVEGISEHGQEQFLKMSTALTQIGMIAKQLTIDIAEWDASAFLGTLQTILGTLNQIRAWFKEDIKQTSDDQVQMFDLAMRPLSEKSKGIWSDLFKYIASGQALIDNRFETPKTQNVAFAGYPASFAGLSNAAVTAPAEKKTEVHINNNFNGVQTPDAIQRAAEKAFDRKWAQKLSDNGQVLGGGPL